MGHSFSLREIGETAWIPFFTATVGNLAGGAVFSKLLCTGTRAATARRIAILIFSALMVSAVFVGKGTSAAQCIVLISIATFGYSGALANLLAVPADVFPKGAVASIWGFASMGSGSCVAGLDAAAAGGAFRSATGCRAGIGRVAIDLDKLSGTTVSAVILCMTTLPFVKPSERSAALLQSRAKVAASLSRD